MQPEQIRALLESVAGGSISAADALEKLRGMPFEDLGFAKPDLHRPLRQGYPEAIYCAGKTPGQIAAIAQRMAERNAVVMGTRCSEAAADAVRAVLPEIVWHPLARCFTLVPQPAPPLPGSVALLAAGTSDLPVAEEAAITLEVLGAAYTRVYDVGVAGIHRLLHHRETLREASVVIVCAGMEGALPSAVAGLVAAPVIGVPCSVGYGASLGGFAALFGMLSSCAAGLTVVNIDNGYGAAIAAGAMLRLGAAGEV